MPPQLALAVGFALIFAAFRWDRKRGIRVSTTLFWPTLWYMVVASRPIGVWFVIWGVPLPGARVGVEDGSLIDRVFYAGLALIGVLILSRRRVSWSAFIYSNRWFLLFLGFMALSLLWSDYTWVSFKRYIKLIGSVVMALVILTEDKPLEAMVTVLRRCLYVHLPMSIIFTKYFRDLGVSFDWSGSAEAWQGIATSKNTLGQVAMLGVVYFAWEVYRKWGQLRWKNHHLLFLGFALFLLKGSDEAVSKTSIAVCIFAGFVFFRIQSLRNRPDAVPRFVNLMFAGTVSLILLVVTHSIVHFSADSAFGKIIELLGRDITLTDRTYIWTDVYGVAAASPIVGVGFGGFWIGRIANIPWNASMTWVLGQGHSGYVDTYLHLGLVGIGLFAVLIFTTQRQIMESFSQNFDFACFRITLFLTALFINITETTFLRGDHHFWLVFLLAILAVHSGVPEKAPLRAAAPPVRDYLRRPASVGSAPR